MRRIRLGRLTVDLTTHPRFWREVGAEYTREIGDERWPDLRSVSVSAWRWQLAVTW